MVNNPLHAEKIMSVLFVELQTCCTFFSLCDCGTLPLLQFLICFWIITVNPTFVTRYDPRDKSWILISLLS
jgi:hypothetical protein